MGGGMFGEGAVWLGTPLGALSMPSASSADGQPKSELAPTSAASPAQWLRCTQSAVSEQKPLLG